MSLSVCLGVPLSCAVGLVPSSSPLALSLSLQPLRTVIHYTWLARSALHSAPVMRPSLDSNGPRVRRSTSHGAPSIAPDGSFVQPLAPASPPSRGISHTPPLPPTTSSSSSHGARQGVDPLAEFSQDKSNFAATDRCLDAACSLFQFEIAEVWCFGVCRCVVNFTLTGKERVCSASACGARIHGTYTVHGTSSCSACIRNLPQEDSQRVPDGLT